MRRLCSLLVLPLAVWACDGSQASGTAMGSVRVMLTSVTSSAPSPGGVLFNLDGNVPIDDAVSSIDVTVDAVDVLPASGGEWIPLSVSSGGDIDLMDLTSVAVVIATGTLAGDEDYVSVRLFLTAQTITLDDDVTLGEDGSGPVLAAGTYDFEIPSGGETGIKTDIQFTVSSGGQSTVTLGFDSEATLRSLAFAPGLETVVLSPVIRAAGDDGD